MHGRLLSRVQLCDPMDWSPPSVHKVYRQEYWGGLPFFPPVELPNLGIEPVSPVSPALAGRFFIMGSPGSNPDLF